LILSFHPIYESDKNLLCAGRDPGEDELSAILSAHAVILPQGCRESLYKMARDNCTHVFPNYDKRFEFPNKVGQARLFEQTEVLYPKTKTFNTVADFLKTNKSTEALSTLQYPFVFKFDWGGEGENVFWVQYLSELERILDIAKSYEKTGQYGFILQKFIPSIGRSLRVVVIHKRFVSYWRRQENRDDFYTNLKKGAKLEMDTDPELQEAAISAAASFCRKTGINLAGFDFLFSESSLENFFGRKGLGGSDAYYQILLVEIDHWIEHLS